MPTTKPKSTEGAKARGEVPINPPFKVAGIGGQLDDIILNSKKFRALVDRGVESATLSRTIEGASTVELGIRDPDLKILNHPMFEDPRKKPVGLELDGLHFRYVQMGKTGKKITPVFEEREISWLRGYKGPRKAYRGKVTRAEFILSLIRTVKEGRIPTYIPELHKRQPIEKDKEHRRSESEDTRGEPGLGRSDVGRISVKRENASITQIHVIDVVLDVGMSMGANFKVLVAAIMTITQETVAQNLDNGAAGVGPFSQEPGTWGQTYPGASLDIAECARGFFEVAIDEDKKNPGQSYADLCQAVQRSGAGASHYAQWQEESTRTVKIYLGGSEAGSSVSQTVTKPYAFEVKKNEDYWTAIKRLAKEVNWRAFFVGGMFYYISEEDLFRGQVRLKFNEDSQGIDNIDFDVDGGKAVHEATVTAHARRWAVPPGMVVRMHKLGPANGRWLVSSIEGSLLSGDARTVTITLKKPSKEKPEPAPETESQSLSVPGSSEGGEKVDRMIEAIEAIDAKQYPYLWGGGHDANFTPPYDCSGFISAVLHAAGLIDSPVTSGVFASLYQSGEGDWLTIYGNAEHVFAKIKTDSGWRYFGTSSENPGGGAGWHSERSGSGFTASHPKGL